jgi:hypothetical protein
MRWLGGGEGGQVAVRGVGVAGPVAAMSSGARTGGFNFD